MTTVDNGSLSTDELNDDIVELCRAIDRMKVLVTEKTAVLEVALATHMPPPKADDARTARQQRHDAL